MRRNGARTRGSRPFSFDTIGGYLYDGAMTDRPHTPLLDTVDVPADLRKLKPEDLPQFADELRDELISAVGSTGGHPGSGLGVAKSAEHTSDRQSPMRISYTALRLQKKSK